MMTPHEIIENRTFEEMRIGDAASITRTLSRDDVALLAAMSGDIEPAHMKSLGVPTAHSMWGGALVAAVIGAKLPGRGAVYVTQSLRFHRQVGAGDTLTAKVTVAEKRPASGTVVLDCSCTDQNGVEVTSGVAEVTAPTQKFRGRRIESPRWQYRHGHC